MNDNEAQAGVETGTEPAGEVQTDILIEHTREFGTLAYGTRKGDAGDQILRSNGFRWFPSHRALGIQHSRDKRAKRYQIEQARKALEAAGLSVTVTIEDTPRPVEVVEADRAERGAGRAGRFAGYAENAAGRAQAAQAKADRVFEGRPPGQPLLVDHYSYTRERNRLDRAHKSEERARDERGKAKYWEGRAEASENEMSHREDVPTTLRRIERLEAEQRKYQRALNGEPGTGWNAGPNGNPDSRAELTARVAELAAEIEYWRGHVAAREAEGVKVWRREDFAKGDYAKCYGYWCEVKRVNPKSVTIPHPMFPWDASCPYDKVTGRMTAAEMAAHNEAAAARRAAKQAEAAGQDGS